MKHPPLATPAAGRRLGCWRRAEASAFNAHPGRHATAPRARHAGYWLLAGPPGWRIGRQAGITTAGKPLPPSGMSKCNHVAWSRVSALSARSRKSAAGARRSTIPPCETLSRRGMPVLSRHLLKPPPLVAFWLPYGPQEPTKRPMARHPMPTDSGRRSEAVLRSEGRGAG